MSKHGPDDFSFLPTVDSTDEELMELEEQRRTAAPWNMEAGPAAAPSTPTPAPQPAETSPQPHPRAAELEKVVNEMLNRPVEYDEPPAQDLPPEQQDGETLWKEFAGTGASETMTTRLRSLASMSKQAPTENVEPAEPPESKPAAVRTPLLAAAPNEADAAEPLPQPAQSPNAEKPASRGKSGRRALVETPPVSFRGAASTVREKASPARPEAAGPPPLPGDNLSYEDRKAVGGMPATPFVAPKAAPEEPLDPEQARRQRWRKLAEKVGVHSLGWSVGVHVLLLSLGAMVGLRSMSEPEVDFLPGGGSAQSQAAAQALSNTIQQKKNPWLKAKPQMRKVTVQTLSSEIVLPEMPMDALDLSSITNRMDITKAGSLGMSAPMGMGTAGSGGGFGAGIGRGGKFSFVGQTALGRRVVFVVDVSGSMSAIGPGEDISRFDLLKKELVKSVNLIPMNTQYQILYFSDFAWPHNEVDSRNTDALLKYRWEIDPKNYKTVKLPPYKFITATPFTIRDTADIIQKSDNPGGTNWGAGLLMALNASPKPDVIFFMTDGLSSDEQGWVDIVTAENKRRMPMTTIHTSAMQQPDAARDLDNLARRNNGKFTVVLGDGKIVKGEDYFKNNR